MTKNTDHILKALIQIIGDAGRIPYEAMMTKATRDTGSTREEIYAVLMENIETPERPRRKSIRLYSDRGGFDFIRLAPKLRQARERQATSTGGSKPQLKENFPEAAGQARDQAGAEVTP